MRFAIALLLLLAACAPALVATPEAREVERAATLAWHRMEAYYLETGGYSTTALQGLRLPRGAMWHLESLAPDDYRLRFSSTLVEGVVWYVTPSGVRQVRL